MIYLFTALYAEADIFIKNYHLEKNLANTQYQEFYREEAGMRLTLTGVGEIAAATAVSSVCTKFKPQEGDFLLNIGICAHLAGNHGVFMCNKIIEQATGKTFYPDLLYHHGLQEETVVTGMLPCNRGRYREPGMLSWGQDGHEEGEILPYSQDGYEEGGISPCSQDGYEKGEIPPLLCDGEGNKISDLACRDASHGGRAAAAENLDETLYDMEAAAIYQAGSYFFGPHQMIFLKVVSDAGMAKEVSKETVKHCMETNQELLFDFIGKIAAITHNKQGKENTFWQEKIKVETLCKDLHCSKVMGDSLKQHMHYWELAGIDSASVIQDMYREGLLPCRDKREGKLRFEELKRRLF